MFENTMNAFEGLRVVLAAVCIAFALFGAINTKQGELLIPRPARARLRMRRKVQMYGFAFIGLVLGAQSLYVAALPDTGFPTLSTYTGNTAIILTLLTLITLAFIHVYGWWREGTIVHIPLNPDEQERADLAIKRGREIAHAALSALQYAAAPFDEALNNAQSSEEERATAQIGLDSIFAVRAYITQLQSEIRSLAKVELRA